MITRYRVLESGHVVEKDDARRDPRLVGRVTWPTFQPESPVRLAPRKNRAPLWESAEWGELVADCDCEDCLAQREATCN